ncbi:MAG: lipocalin family protein, partial [Rikenellaceae bacterium]
KLKVSFFRPFYGKYWIIDLSSDYFWAVISNPTRSTLWILCRNRTINHQLYHSILERVKTNGFDISKLVKMESHLLLSGKNFTCDV